MWKRDQPKGASETPLPQMRLDEYFDVANESHLDEPGLIFAPTSEKISYGKIKESYTDTLKSLVGMGLEPGDNVAVSLLNVPQMAYIVLACAKAGLSINMIDPLPIATGQAEQVTERIRNMNAKALFVQDKMVPLYSPLKCHIDVDYLVSVPIVAGHTNKEMDPLDGSVGWWDDFIANGRYMQNTSSYLYDTKDPLIYTYSSGSTGQPKPIELGHDTFTHTAHMHQVGGFDIERGGIWHCPTPAIYSTGINTGFMLPMLLGLLPLLEPNFDPEVFKKNIRQWLPPYVLATKYFWKDTFRDPMFEDADLSGVKYWVNIGEKVRRHEIRRDNKWLRAHGCKRPKGNGFGQCELGGGTGNSLIDIDDNSIGIPYTHNNMRVVSIDTGEECDYCERGELQVQTTTGMFKYPGMPEATAKYYANGWANLGDIGYQNEQGHFYCDGRLTDFIKISEDDKLYPYEVEDIMESLLETDPTVDEAILDYAVLGMRNADYEIPVLHVHLATEYQSRTAEILCSVIKFLNDRLDAKKRIVAINLRNKEFPSSRAGKTLLAPLMEETENFVAVDDNKKLCPYSP
jgi:long-chain acyl-CoA synthetase